MKVRCSAEGWIVLLEHTSNQRTALGVERSPVVELSVFAGRVIRLAPIEWLMTLELASTFGWKPTGAIAVDKHGRPVGRDIWYGLNHRDEIAYRAIEADDISALSAAIERGAAVVARESDELENSLIEHEGHPHTYEEGRPTALTYFIDQEVAAAWLFQLAADLDNTVTLTIMGPSEQLKLASSRSGLRFPLKSDSDDSSIHLASGT